MQTTKPHLADTGPASFRGAHAPSHVTVGALADAELSREPRPADGRAGDLVGRVPSRGVSSSIPQSAIRIPQSMSLRARALATPRLRPGLFFLPSAFCLLSSLSLLLFLFALAPFARAGAGPAAGNQVECANLIYAGTKSSVCFSEEFLGTVAAQTSIHTSRKFKPVKLGESEVFDFPFAVMTGEGAFSLTDDERKNLKLYLEKGGFLLASAGCSSKEWGDSFAREMEAILPDHKLDEVHMDHPIFRTVFDVDKLDMSHGGEARLLGLSIAGKIVVIYSPDGLNDTASMSGCCCCGGNEIRNSQKVNANILAYALLQ